MLLIVGLGNPGKEYALTRHNVGWLVIDEVAAQQNLSWKLQKKLQAEVAKNAEMILAKPQTYMNLSGAAVSSVVTSYELRVTNIAVIHDDIDLEFGTIRVSQNASSAGHKGVQSIIDSLSTKDFWRVRVGIHPTIAQNPSPVTRNSKTPAINTPDFVLKKFSAEEKKKLPKIIEASYKILQEFLTHCHGVKTIRV